MSVLSVVKGCPLFYELYDEEIMKIVDHCEVMNLEPGNPIFKEGDSGDELFLILSGSAVVKKGEISIAKLRKGDLFGEMVLLKENVRKADIEADNYTDVLVVSYADIFGLYGKDDKIFGILMLNLSRMLATRLNKAGDSIRDLSIENASFKKGKKKAA